MATTTVSLEDAVLEAAAHLYVWALKDIPQDLRDALAAAKERETSVTGNRVLETILRNVEIADDQKNLVCQDTGIAVYYCNVGEHFRTGGHGRPPCATDSGSYQVAFNRLDIMSFHGLQGAVDEGSDFV